MKPNQWPFLFIIMAIIAFSAIIISFQEEEKNAVYRARIFEGVNTGREAPSDIVSGGALKYNEEQVRIEYNISYPCWGGDMIITREYGNGSKNSMIPTISHGHQALCLSLNSLECLNAGDIVVNKESGNTHRIITKGEDENGTFIFTMGDNNFGYSDYDVVLRNPDELCAVFGIIY
jgi:hypothetical protein